MSPPSAAGGDGGENGTLLPNIIKKNTVDISGITGKPRKQLKSLKAQVMDVAYEEPGSSDLYSDGSVVRGAPIGIPDLPISSSSSANNNNNNNNNNIMSKTMVLSNGGTNGTNHKIQANPAAGDIRYKELNGLWMTSWNMKTDIENEKADEVIHEKRIFGLAKQTTKGLSEIGIEYEPITVANILRLAYKHIGNRGKVGGSSGIQKTPEIDHALQVLDSVKKFDLKKVAHLLSIHVNQPKTWGKQRQPKMEFFATYQIIS